VFIIVFQDLRSTRSTTASQNLCGSWRLRTIFTYARLDFGVDSSSPYGKAMSNVKFPSALSYKSKLAARERFDGVTSRFIAMPRPRAGLFVL